MEDFRVHEFPRNQYGREIYLSTAILWGCRISVPRFSLKKKKIRKIKTLKGNTGKPPGQMTIHRNASRTNNHLGYTNGTYLQYLKSDSNLIRCRKKCTEWTWVLKFQCASESPVGLAKSEAPRGPFTEIPEWGPQIYVFHKNHWSLLQVKLLKDINLSQETKFPPSPLALLPFSCSPKTALIKATITPIFPSL